jgi:hypothetical protein
MTVPAGWEEDTSLRPVPWRRMGWVTWRQHRVTLAVVAVFLGALAVALWLAGRQLRSAHAAAIAACHPASSLACPNMVIAFDGTNDFLANGGILQAVPVLIGAFVGAPLLARELETGTFRYAWTQASAGGAGRSPSWCCSRSCLPPPPGCSACCCPGTTCRTSPRATRPYHLRR